MIFFVVVIRWNRNIQHNMVHNFGHGDQNPASDPVSRRPVSRRTNGNPHGSSDRSKKGYVKLLTLPVESGWLCACSMSSRV